MNFFIIARAPKGAWALLILWGIFLGDLQDLVVQFKHLGIQLTYHLGTVHKFQRYAVRRIAFELVVDLVLQACPEVHCNSTYLDLNLDLIASVGQIYGHGDYQMIALVSAGFGIDDVILDREDRDVILCADHLGDPVYIGCKRADDADSRYIIAVLDHVLEGGFNAVTAEFFYNALGRLDPALDVLDRIVSVDLLKLIVKYLHAGHDEFESRTVTQLQRFVRLHVPVSVKAVVSIHHYS